MNKRVSIRRPKSTQDLAKTANPAELRQLRSRSRALQQEIHHLECAIVAAPQSLRRQRLAHSHVLPPLEPRLGSPKRLARRVPLHQLKTARRRRLALMLELSVVLLTLVAALGWLNQWFQLWP